MAASCQHLIRILTLVAAAAAAAANGLTSADSMRARCDPDRYYDEVAQQCTPCTDICDPARGTPYLCLKHFDVCIGKLDINLVV